MVDLVAIGGGAAGLAAAREARRRGRSAALISDGPLGGDCTFTGCVPSKTLIESTRSGLGIADAFDRVRATIDVIATTESAEVLRTEGIDVIEGLARIVAPGRVEINGREVTASGIVVATGSRPVVPAIPGIDHVTSGRVLTTDDLWDLRAEPKSVAIVGGGAIGCELGTALAVAGVEVTVIEAAPRVLVTEEEAASGIVTASLRALGVDVLCGSMVARLEPTAEGVRLHLGHSHDNDQQPHRLSVEAEYVLLAVGRRPEVNVGVDLARTPSGFISTSPALETSMPGVFAAGDTTGLAPFTTAADAMGRLAATNIVRRASSGRLGGRLGFRLGSRLAPLGDSSFDPSMVPRVTYTDPEVASIGLSEADAAERYRGAMVAELPLSEHDRAVAAGRTDGYITLIAAPRRVGGMLGGGRLVGATIVAPRAAEMIAELSLLMRSDALVGRLAQTMHPYPSWSYGLQKAAGQFFTAVEGRSARPAGK